MAPASGRAHRRAVLWAGSADSLGLAFGWTAFNLLAIDRQGLAAVGTYNAAMLLGVTLAAPAAGWLATRLSGRHLLRTTAGSEALLRVLVFVLLLAGAPVGMTALAVLVLNVVGWTGHAAMRSEIAGSWSTAPVRPWDLTSSRPDERGATPSAALSRYAGAILGVEALGSALAALLPLGSGPDLATRAALVGAIAVYVLSVLPVLVLAGDSATAAGSGERARWERPRGARLRLLLGGTGMMALCGGPLLLFAAIAQELHGRRAVALAAGGFAVGALAAPAAGALLARGHLRPSLAWPLCGAGMVAGWILAPLHPAWLVLAQLSAGMSLSTFEGVMDADMAATAGPARVTGALAEASAARAFGGAVGVRTVAWSAGALGPGTSAVLLTAAVGAVALAAAGWRSRPVSETRSLLAVTPAPPQA